MVIEACYNRELPARLKKLTAYQLPGPIHLRMVSPHVSDFAINERSFSTHLSMLRASKNAMISLLVDRKWLSSLILKSGQKPDIVAQLEEAGINILTARNLHAKIIMLKAGKDKALLVGSANLTKTAMYISHEAAIYMLNDSSGAYEKIDYYVTELFKNAQPA